MTNLFYRNKRLLALFIGLIIVAGLSAFQILPRLEDPVLTNRFATVKTIFPGATAERVEALVTEKLEEEIREVEEIQLVESQSRSGIATVTIELRDDIEEVDEVWSRVRDKVEDARGLFPAGVLEPEFEVSEVGAFARIVAICWTQSDQPNYAILRRQAEELEQVLRAIRGTEKVEIYGEPDEEIAVAFLPERLVQLNLTPADVARQLAASDAKLAAGQYRGQRETLLMEIDSELQSLERIRQIPIRYASGGRFVPLGSIAEVRKGIKTPADELAMVNGYPAVVVAARVQADRRIDHWAEDAERSLLGYARQLPRGLEMHTVFQQDEYVAQRMDDLLRNLGLGAAAVMLVMLVMMGWRSALIVGTTLPLASLMVIAGLKVLDIPIHQMSITGLIIALGLLIDNAIVAVDAVRHHLGRGEAPAEAVRRSVRHLAIPLFGSSLTTALAFAPIAIMPGPAGEFVGSIAISVILAVFASLLLSLTVVVALAAMQPEGNQSGSNSWWRDGLRHPRLTQWYADRLSWLFARPWRGVVLAAALPAVGFLSFGSLTEQFFPPEERNQFHIELELPPQASLDLTWKTIRRAREQILAHDEIRSVDWFVGASAPPFYYNVIPKRENTAPYAQAVVTTNAPLRRKTLLRQLQRQMNLAHPESRVLVRQLEQGPPFDAPVEIRLFGPDLEQLRLLGDEMRGLLAAIPDVVHTTADLSETVPKIGLRVDEEQARLAGLDHAEISRQLNASLEGAVGGSFLEGTEELPVRLRLDDPLRGDLQRIAALDLLSRGPARPEGNAVPLETLADLQLLPQPALIAHRDGRRVNEVKAYLQAGVLPGLALGEFRRQLAAADLQLPPGYELQFGGEAAERDRAVGNLFSSVAPLITIMIATLVLAFGSFRLAGMIGGVGTLSIGLGISMLWLFDFPFGFMAIVGTMGLVGVAINDSIVVLAALQADERAKTGDPTAVRRVVVDSTRHVLATTLTTMAGFVPLVVWGGAFWAPLAITIAGGVAGATFLALCFIPSSYILIKGSAVRLPSTQRQSQRCRETQRVAISESDSPVRNAKRGFPARPVPARLPA
jgi:multidrug efflux pump subunit AcrB